MANTLSVAAWKKILKDHPDAAETAPLTKALEAFGKAEAKDDPESRLVALKDVINAAKDARAGNLKDKKKKDLVDFLVDLAGDVATEKVKTERLVEEEREREDDEDGGDERAKLTGMLLRVKKLDADKAKPFVLALGNKAHGLVIAKGNALSDDHKKRARAMRAGNGPVFLGKCFGEGGKYVFEFAIKPAGGLAKALKKAAGAHTDLPPLKLLVRSPDSDDIDDENDTDELADLGPDTGDADQPPASDRPPLKVPPRVAEQFQTLYAQAENRLAAVRRLAPTNADTLVPLLAQAKGHGNAGKIKEALTALKAFQEKANLALRSALTAERQKESWANERAALEPEYLAALRNNPARAGTMRAVWSFATEKGEAGQYAQARAAVKRLRGWLSTGNGAKPATVNGPPLKVAVDLSAWTAARDDIVRQVRKVAAAFAATRDPRARPAILELQSIIKNLSLRPTTPENVARLEHYLRQDDVIAAAEEVHPPFGTLSIRKPLLDALRKGNA